MCVENLGKKLKGTVWGWKVFEKHKNGLYSLAAGPYRVFRGQAFPTGEWVKSPNEPGFQTYVKKPDLNGIVRIWQEPYVLRRVKLRQVRKGLINDMDDYSDGRAGYCAQEVFILRRPPMRQRKKGG